MTRLRRATAAKVLVCVALVGAAVAAALVATTGDAGRASAQEQRAQAAAARGSSVPRPARLPALSGFDPRVHRPQGEVLVGDLAGGAVAVLTLDPALQAHLVRALAQYEVPYAAVVAVEPATGRVLAYVSHSSANPDAPDLALDPTPPAASVFKIITAAALVDAGVGGDTRVCYQGGSSRLSARNLEDGAGDRACATLGEAVGGSINAVFAKLADRNLDTPTLERYASAFGFGHALPFDVRTLPSPGEVPSRDADRLEFARTSAGFWHMHMSPLHGALIAATFANDGKMPRAAIVDHVVEADGTVVHRHEPEVFRAVISRRTARAVGEMMELTVAQGTSRRAFHDERGNPFLPGIRVAGKTGTLSGTDPYRGYTWWVGYAPADAPTIAVAALVVNRPQWRIKASYVAREALRAYLVR